MSDAANPSTPVRNPCVGVCALDHNDFCIACHRSGMEIAEWGVMTEDQKREVIRKVIKRESGDLSE